MNDDRPTEPIETAPRIEPARLENPPEVVADLAAELSASSARLGRSLHLRTAANLADLVRVMNTYYSNLIEGHATRPRDIERALAGDFDADEGRRNLQTEAAAHVRVQAEVDRMAADGRLPEPASIGFIQWLHREFYRDAPEAMLRINGRGVGHESDERPFRADVYVGLGAYSPRDGGTFTIIGQGRIRLSFESARGSRTEECSFALSRDDSKGQDLLTLCDEPYWKDQ